MAEEITEILQKFALSTKELGGTELELGDVSPSVKECEESLVGKIKGEKVINFVGVKNFVTLAWGYPKGLRVVEVGVNTFQFFMANVKDRERICTRGPWVIDSQILVIRPWFDGFEENEVEFNIAPLWIQVWNLPVHWISKEVGKKIASVFHGTKEVIIPQGGGKEGRHIKILVLADISEPLMRGTTVKLEGKVKWLSFKYERCPDFCYTCGKIGHSERNCSDGIQLGKGHQDNQFGPWLGAGGENHHRKKNQEVHNLHLYLLASKGGDLRMENLFQNQMEGS
ncbi:uncharacterized protein LOC113777336 [Coffea eugenioides]|uniref:uncharacterized protein LOC113777336 n=1 Tax=Coffea eugenioides TaxID=49369 RepID=UPI000F60B444|nr:uncharacterized protein LOC113777336 [Coffea eugenioides]